MESYLSIFQHRLPNGAAGHIDAVKLMKRETDESVLLSGLPDGSLEKGEPCCISCRCCWPLAATRVVERKDATVERERKTQDDAETKMKKKKSEAHCKTHPRRETLSILRSNKTWVATRDK